MSGKVIFTPTNTSVTAALVAFLNTLVTAVIAFGVKMSNDQQVAITSVINAGVILVVALLALHSSRRRDDEIRRIVKNGGNGKAPSS